jgi:hypothetical protein
MTRIFMMARSFSCRSYEGMVFLAQDTGDEDPYIDTKDVLKLLIVGDSAVRLLITLGARSAWWKAAEKSA